MKAVFIVFFDLFPFEALTFKQSLCGNNEKGGIYIQLILERDNLQLKLVLHVKQRKLIPLTENIMGFRSHYKLHMPTEQQQVQQEVSFDQSQKHSE